MGVWIKVYFKCGKIVETIICDVNDIQPILNNRNKTIKDIEKIDFL